MRIAHFDVDKAIYPLLRGDRREQSVSPEKIASIDAKKLEVISIKSQSKITKDVLDRLPHLRAIVTRTVGTDHIDSNACKKRKIAVYNIPDYGPEYVAQHAFALILAGANNIVQADRSSHAGEFDYRPFLSRSLSGKTLGIIGTGKIGVAVARIAVSFGMRVIGYDIYENDAVAKKVGFSYSPLTALLAKSDVVSLHIPSTPETKHIINHNTLKHLKDRAILVNTARGDLIDTDALLTHIGRLHAVCLDVIENESEFSKRHPLLKYANVIITPHMAFYSDRAVVRIATETEKIVSQITE